MPALEQNRSIGPLTLAGAGNERLDVGVLAHVGRDREPADLLRHRLRGPLVEVGDDHRPGALGGEPARQRAADAAAGAGDDDVTVGELPRRATIVEVEADFNWSDLAAWPSAQRAFPPRRGVRRPARAARGRAQALVEAARRVFERDGFLEARITDITAEAGVAAGTFYTYFTSKEDAFAAVMEEVERGDAPPAARAIDRPR